MEKWGGKLSKHPAIPLLRTARAREWASRVGSTGEDSVNVLDNHRGPVIPEASYAEVDSNRS